MLKVRHSCTKDPDSVKIFHHTENLKWYYVIVLQTNKGKV
jgi:hypothetical protein